MKKAILLALSITLLTGCLKNESEYPPGLSYVHPKIDAADEIRRKEALRLKYSTKPHEQCEYQHYTRSDLYNNDQNYKTLHNSNFKYKRSLQSNHFRHKELVLEYESKTHIDKPSQAVILIHGNSSTPDQFFNNPLDPNGIPVYLNNAGDKLFSQNFDIYAPYVTHASRYQNANRRQLSTEGKKPQHNDVQRILKMYDKIKNKYDTIHIAGVSYGGVLAVSAYQQIRKQPNKVGKVLSFEGWGNNLAILRNISFNDFNMYLFEPNFEMVFVMVTEAEFWEMLADPKVFLAYSSCFRRNWEDIQEEIIQKEMQDKLIYYKGTHEFKTDVFLNLIENK